MPKYVFQLTNLLSRKHSNHDCLHCEFSGSKFVRAQEMTTLQSLSCRAPQVRLHSLGIASSSKRVHAQVVLQEPMSKDKCRTGLRHCSSDAWLLVMGTCV